MHYSTGNIHELTKSLLIARDLLPTVMSVCGGWRITFRVNIVATPNPFSVRPVM